MAIWKEQTTPKKEPTLVSPDTGTRKDEDGSAVTTPNYSGSSQSYGGNSPSYASSTPTYETPRRSSERGDTRETVIAANLTVEGKIQGTGHVRVAGQFKGDVHVEGNLTIDAGAKVTGGVRASTVTIAGELEGNVDAAARVELLDSGVINGDLKAGSLTVAAGSRMRGQAEFGWGEDQARGSRTRMDNDTAA